MTNYLRSRRFDRHHPDPSRSTGCRSASTGRTPCSPSRTGRRLAARPCAQASSDGRRRKEDTESLVHRGPDRPPDRFRFRYRRCGVQPGASRSGIPVGIRARAPTRPHRVVRWWGATLFVPHAAAQIVVQKITRDVYSKVRLRPNVVLPGRCNGTVQIVSTDAPKFVNSSGGHDAEVRCARACSRCYTQLTVSGCDTGLWRRMGEISGANWAFLEVLRVVSAVIVAAAIARPAETFGHREGIRGGLPSSFLANGDSDASGMTLSRGGDT